MSHLDPIAIRLRASQFIAHNAHNLASGPTFFTDHKFFGKAYPAYEAAYDSVVERMIGLGEKPDLTDITTKAARELYEYQDTTPIECYESLLEGERELLDLIAKCCEEVSCGTSNLLANLADDAEVRIYQINQRIA